MTPWQRLRLEVLAAIGVFWIVERMAELLDRATERNRWRR